MKRLLLLRHAKSSWDDPDQRDFDRPLAPRGERDAPRIGKALRRRPPAPETILSSPALRARQTIDRVAAEARWKASPQGLEALYGASSGELLEVIRGLPEGCGTALLVGHNPGLEDLLLRLTGAFVRMPTGAAACVACDTDRWGQVADGVGVLEWRLTPKTLCETEG